MKTHNDQLSGTGMRAMSRFFIYLVYRIRLLRIAHGFSQEDLSILLGYAPPRIGHIERFEPRYGFVQSDLLRLSEILACPLQQFFEPAAGRDIAFIIPYERREARNIIQEVYEKKPEGTEVLLYKLVETDHSGDTLNEAVRLKTNQLIGNLVKGGYFDAPWEVFEIFNVCRQTVGHSLKPGQLVQLLDSFEYKSQARLRRHPGEHHCSWIAQPRNPDINLKIS